jgi:hypothetical protein
MRLADCREAAQSLYSVNRVEATVFRRVQGVLDAFAVVLT